ncbi:TetR family transcriptional regulator [Salinicola tamaricis]|uniref:TetR family transcriptional regulator n=1 Tax=Salinicola tamaricis TaxID=1771309 RepID=UPI001F5CEAA5|nr:TetR family transcriptional regulator [Salinicola tamaricis]
MTSSPRPTTARARASEARRQTILDAALSLFSQFGLHGASLDAIAELAGVSKTNLLYHYASKDTLPGSVRAYPELLAGSHGSDLRQHPA